MGCTSLKYFWGKELCSGWGPKEFFISSSTWSSQVASCVVDVFVFVVAAAAVSVLIVLLFCYRDLFLGLWQ